MIRLSIPVRQALAKLIEEKFGRPDVIAGVATAAIAQGALVSESLGLPFIYVRSSPKDHGRENLIEGDVKAGQSVVVIEDLISTGGSSLKAVKALRDAGCKVSGMVSVFTYGFGVAEENFRNANCPVYSLCDYETMIAEALNAGFISSGELHALRAWRESPETWGQ